MGKKNRAAFRERQDGAYAKVIILSEKIREESWIGITVIVSKYI